MYGHDATRNTRGEMVRFHHPALTGVITMIAMLLAIAIGQPPEALPVERYRWHDADTAVGAVVRLPYGVLLEGTIRAADYDAWEVGSRTGSTVAGDEKTRGIAARDALAKLAEGGSLYIVPVPPGTRDSFGRLLGRLYIRRASGELVDVRQWAINGGHVRTVGQSKKGR
jgi:endonuclease YncB( thermonuclease family)